MDNNEALKFLDNFLVNNVELEELSARLSTFNIFNVLRIENKEIRHSNALAWLIDPQESHGLGQIFLRRFLSTILLDNENVDISLAVSAKFTEGTISSLTGFQDDLRLYQISVPVQPGNSGGALVDENGNVLGIIVAMLDAKTTFRVSGSLPQNVNYAVKSVYAQAMLDTLPEVSDINFTFEK
jgi:hypothetical protein